MKLLITVLLLASSSLAQAKVDFSGIFLRTQNSFRGHSEPAAPRILEITQAADDVVVAATQNGETAVVHYRLNQKSEAVQAHLKGDELVLKGTVKRQWPEFGLGMGLFWPGVAANVEEKWTLSADSQQLVIRTKENIGGIRSDLDTHYAREPSLEAARAAADLAAKKNCETTAPIATLRSQKETTRKYDQGVNLGFAHFVEITRCVVYDGVLSGDFFKNLERTRVSGQAQFQKSGVPVTAYSDDLVLEIGLHPWVCAAELGNWTPTGPPPPEAAKGLRFRVRWMGAEQKDVGEVESEFRLEPWREQSAPEAFYRMRIPAQDVPLTDDLEVLIFSKSGEQLACVRGQI